MLLVAVMDLVVLRLPEKVDEPVPDRVRLPVEARVKSLRLLPFNMLNDSEVAPPPSPPATKVNLA